jgi:orotate phosphoribosyltransferase
MDPVLTALAADIDAVSRLNGRFVLRSGAIATEYFDKYRFETRPDLLRRVAESMVPLLPGDTEALGGLELGGVPIATIVSSMTGLPVLFIRKQAKPYGTAKLAEGGEFTGRQITLIEDVITTGGAVIAAALALRELGGLVHTVVCAIDRSEPGANRLSEVGLTSRSVLTRRDLDAARVDAATD